MRTSKLLACRNSIVRRSELQDIVARFHTFKFPCSSVRIDTIIFSTIILSFIAMLQWIPLCSQCMKLNSAMVGQNKGILMRVICLAQVVTLCKDLSEGDDQLVKCKDTGLYLQLYIYKPWGDNESVLEETIWSQQGKYEEASTTIWGEYKVQ